MAEYTVSQDKKSGAYYCHKKGFQNIPVFGSIGDKSKALEICRLYNSTSPNKGGKRG